MARERHAARLHGLRGQPLTLAWLGEAEGVANLRVAGAYRAKTCHDWLMEWSEPRTRTWTAIGQVLAKNPSWLWLGIGDPDEHGRAG